ncbi:MAG: rhodanese-like domain-containing protein [Bacteroidales bacterium]
MRKHSLVNGILIVLSLMALDVNGQNNDVYQSIEAEDFYKKMNQEPDALVIDVCLEEDFKQKRIPGAFSAAEPDKLKELTESLDKNTPLLLYCYDGERSETACEILTEDYGFQNVFNLTKGLERWEELGFPVDHEEMDEIE